MERGKVKWFNEEKGYGFITPVGKSKDVFVHISNVDADETLKEGDEVYFDVVEGVKGPNATKVKFA
jgi:CspA family cold shock protein